MIGEYVCQSAHIYSYSYLWVCVRVFAGVCVSEPAPQMLLLCIFAYSLHTHSIKHAFGSAAHSFMPSFAFRQIFVFMNRFFVCLPQFSPYFFFLLSFCAPIGISFVQFLTHGQQLQALQTSSSGWNSNSICFPFSHPFEFLFDHNCEEEVGGAWHLLYASFKVTKCWFIEGLDGKTNRNSLNFTWLNVLHKFFISFTQLPWHFVQEK